MSGRVAASWGLAGAMLAGCLGGAQAREIVPFQNGVAPARS